MLQIENVHSYYSKSHVLQGISLEVKPSEIVCLLGRNGVGKTTTFQTIMGFVKAKQGRIEFLGKEIQDLPPYKVARCGIGYVPQGRYILPELTVQENMRLACVKGRMNPRILGSAYDLFPILKSRLAQFGGTLSGGEQQMLAIARAMLQDPKIILMDEPTEGLMPIIISNIKEAIRVLKGQGISILLVDQIVDMALELSDRAYIMEKGMIKFCGFPEELTQNKDILHRYLGVKHGQE